MSEKTPRLKPYKRIVRKSERDVIPPIPLSPDQQRRLGQLSPTDGIPIIREAPTELESVLEHRTMGD
jgi:hypothetical protein